MERGRERMGPGQVHDLKVCSRETKPNETLTVRTCGSGPLKIRRGQERIVWHQGLFILCPEIFMSDICPVVCGAAVLEHFFQSRARSLCGLVSLMLLPGIHACWASVMEDFQCPDELLAVPTKGHTLGPRSMPQRLGK